jgi:putative flippase GtrA
MPGAAPPSDNERYTLAPGSDPSLRKRIISGRSANMLLRNTVVSCAAFALGLAVLWMLVQKLGMNSYLAVAFSFFTANSIHYVIGRIWIFPGSDRKLGSGYIYFFVNAALGLVANIALFALFTELGEMNYLVARIVASLFAGLAMFASNALFNFKAI